MKSSIKLATVFAVVASLGLPSAFAAKTAKSDDWFSNSSVGANASGTLLYNAYDLDSIKDEEINTLGEHIQVKDLKGDVDAITTVIDQFQVGARLGLEYNSDSLKFDGTEAKSKIKDAYVGVARGNLVVIYGRKDASFGGDVTRRANDRGDALHRSLEQNERKVLAAVQVDPSFIKALSAIKSIELSAFDNNTDPTNAKLSGKLSDYSARVIAQLGAVLTQASYMRIDNTGETRWSVSGETGLSTQITGPFQVYGEVQTIRDSAANGDLNLGTVGVEKQLPSLFGKPTSAFLEGTMIKNKNTNKSSKSGAIGVKHQSYTGEKIAIETAAEYSTNAPVAMGAIASEKDPTVSIQMTMKAANKDTKTNLFPRAKAAKNAREAAVDKMLAK